MPSPNMQRGELWNQVLVDKTFCANNFDRKQQVLGDKYAQRLGIYSHAIILLCGITTYIQVNIVITRSLGSNELNRVISESCYTKKSTRKRYQKRMSNNRKTIVIISCLVCTGVTCYVTAITYNNKNNIIIELSKFLRHNNCNVLQLFYRTNVYRMNTIKITINYTSLCSRGVANLLYFSSLLHAYTYHCAQCVTQCIWYLHYHLHVIIREHYYYLIAHNIINVSNISAVAVSVTAITSAVDDWHHCPHADWFR